VFVNDLELCATRSAFTGRVPWLKDALCWHEPEQFKVACLTYLCAIEPCIELDLAFARRIENRPVAPGVRILVIGYVVVQCFIVTRSLILAISREVTINVTAGCVAGAFPYAIDHFAMVGIGMECAGQVSVSV
jgi:hypothetical protein